MPFASSAPRVIVVGAGIAGLCTAAALVRRGVIPTVLERFAPDHAHGSSHGPTRITRSVYSDAAFVRLMQTIHAEHWPRLEAWLGEKLIFPTEGLFFGHGKLWRQYLEAVTSQAVDVEPLDTIEGRRRFPAFALTDAESVLHDHTAGVIAAHRVLSGLRRRLPEHGVEISSGVHVLRIEPEGSAVRVETSRGNYVADRVVLCAGAWVRDLLPELASRLTVLRQTVAYYRLALMEAAHRPPNFPVWVGIGDDQTDVYYGLPEFDRPGVKVGRHRTLGAGDDPDREADPAAELAELDAFVAKTFACPVERRISHERCLYTVTDDEDFVLGPLPDRSNLIVGSACSGHGFKFGPWVGDVLADFAHDGKCDDPSFGSLRVRFAVRTVS